MNLPVRIQSEPGPETELEPVISVDGAWGAPGLNLSHWPGNTTPEELRHDLSTGSALAFSRLPEERRSELARGCVALANNHVDTDGVCALFAVARPDEALPRAELLLKAARAGDFYRPEDAEAMELDALITACLDSKRSPWRERTRGLPDDERHEVDVRELIERLPAILDGERAEYEHLVRPEVEDWQSDRRDLEACTLVDIAHLDLAVWNAPPSLSSSRVHAKTKLFDPGRHAVFSMNEADRVLIVGQAGGGPTYRFLISTLSWFDQSGRPCLPRPRLAELAQDLNRLEGTSEDDAVRWHAQKDDGASPELWFGDGDQPPFPEHASNVLATSRLEPEVVREAVLQALRATWVFPD